MEEKEKKIKHPNYKGQWKTPWIDNPNCEDDPNLYVLKPIKYAGIGVCSNLKNFGDALIVDGGFTVHCEGERPIGIGSIGTHCCILPPLLGLALQCDHTFQIQSSFAKATSMENCQKIDAY
ncbi:hypothetical protein Ancab_002880 [Ancistrocladus abbreviatus]